MIIPWAVMTMSSSRRARRDGDDTVAFRRPDVDDPWPPGSGAVVLDGLLCSGRSPSAESVGLDDRHADDRVAFPDTML
jgi:hypothetical protein